jgi:hypothetical protein
MAKALAEFKFHCLGKHFYENKRGACNWLGIMSNSGLEPSDFTNRELENNFFWIFHKHAYYTDDHHTSDPML